MQVHAPTGGVTKSFTKISDSWHIFAHHHHWISIALLGEYEVTTMSAAGVAPTTITRTESLGLALLKLGADDTVSDAVMVFTPTSSDDYLLGQKPLRPTNDHFLGMLSYRDSGHLAGLGSPFDVGLVQGVATAVRHQPDAGAGTAGHTVYRRDTDLYDLGATAFYADGWEHNNEASSIAFEHHAEIWEEWSHGDPPRVLAPSSDGQSVLLIEATQAWELDRDVAAVTVLPRAGDSTGDLYSMISAVRIRGDLLVVAYRKAAPIKTAARPEDGEIHLEVWNEDHNLLVEADPLPSSSGARPHVAVSDEGTIYLAWDESDGVHLAEYRFGLPRVGIRASRRATSATAPYPDGTVAAEPADHA